MPETGWKVVRIDLLQTLLKLEKMKIPVNHLTPVKLKIGLPLFIFTFVSFMLFINWKPVDYTGQKYLIKILNEHDVQCASAAKDTIILSFENAYVLCDETLVFIKK